MCKNLVGENIQFFRSQLGYTQEQLAERVGLSTTYISHLENGYKSPSLKVLFRIAESLRIKPALLLISDRNVAEEVYAIQKLIFSNKETSTSEVLRLIASVIERKECS